MPPHDLHGKYREQQIESLLPGGKNTTDQYSGSKLSHTIWTNKKIGAKLVIGSRRAPKSNIDALIARMTCNVSCVRDGLTE